MAGKPLATLQAIGVRYRQSKPAPRDERALDAYAAAGVYQQAHAPFEVVEPAMPEVQRREEENDNTKEPDGPDMAQVKAAVRTVMATGKVAALAIGSVYGEGEGSDVSIASGIELISTGLEAWRQYGLPAVPMSV